MGSRLFHGTRFEPEPTAEPTVSLLNDLRSAVELDLGDGWQALESWQSRQMVREGFAIRLSADRTRMWRIGTNELVSQGKTLRTSKDLGLFSQEMKAEAYKEWSEMYLEDVPGGKLQLVNDLDAAVEVDNGRGWRILYPNQKRELTEESFSIRLREDPAVMSTIGQGRASDPEYCLRTSTDLAVFSSKASSWVANEQKAVQKETEERQRRKKLSEAQVTRSARKLAVIWFLAIVCAAVVLIPAMAFTGLLSHACAGLGATLVLLLVHVNGLDGTEDPEDFDDLLSNQFHHPVVYLFFIFVGTFAGTWARSILPDGQTHDSLRDTSRRWLLEETIVFQGTVMEGQGKPCITSWPGKYATAWDCLVESAREGETSAAVVFLPEGTKEFGRHSNIPHSEGLEGDCWCTPLYGEQKPWGCRWWALWIENVEKAVRFGAELHVYFFQQACGQGKVQNFDTAGRENLRREAIFARMNEFEESEEYRSANDAGIENLCKNRRHDSSSQHSREKHRLFLHWLPIEDGRFLKESEGLGNSQKAEVAWLERKGYRYTEVDIGGWLQPDELRGDCQVPVRQRNHKTPLEHQIKHAPDGKPRFCGRQIVRL
ncbi:unnamed protein product [Symbiodinium sp. CCMP2456]|nr:unnamed protein product [Symbiodinium sp. CCMP2456]